MAIKEIDKLVDILSKQKDKYSEKQIKNAILAEGYSEDMAKDVLAKIYAKDQKQEVPIVTKQASRSSEREKVKTDEIKSQEPIKEIPKEVPPAIKQNTDYYSEVNLLIDQLKEINKVKKMDISTPNLLKDNEIITTQNNNLQTNNLQNNSSSQINSNDVNQQIEFKKQELAKIKIETEDDVKIIIKDGTIINLNDYPRREWRSYRDQGKSVAENKEEQMQKIRMEIYALKRQSGRSQEVTQEENISKKISDRVRLKTGNRVPEKRIEIASKNEAEKLREKYKSEEIERKDLDTAVENIYTQMMKNPNIYDDDKTSENTNSQTNQTQKQENKTASQKTDELNDMSLDTNFNLDSNNSNDNSGNGEFDLGLDLSLDDKKKKK